jgi:hypothetical protein
MARKRYLVERIIGSCGRRRRWRVSPGEAAEVAGAGRRASEAGRAIVRTANTVERGSSGFAR